MKPQRNKLRTIIRNVKKNNSVKVSDSRSKLSFFLNKFWMTIGLWSAITAALIGIILTSLTSSYTESINDNHKKNKIIEEINLIDSLILTIGDFTPDEIIDRRIVAYDSLIKGLTNFPSDTLLALTLKKLGDCYDQKASQSQRPEIDWQFALKSYNESLAILDIHPNLLLQARINNNAGNVYLNWSKIRNKGENLKFGIGLLVKAKGYFVKEKYTFQYATICNNLGVGYSDLGILERNADLLRISINLHREALCIFDQNMHLDDHVNSLICLGNSLLQLSEFDNNDSSSISESIELFNKAFNFLSSENEPIAKGKCLNGLAGAYKEMSNFKDKENYLKLSEHYYLQSLEVISKDKYPAKYAALHHNLIMVRVCLFETTQKIEYLNNAILDGNEALQIRSFIENPVGFASTCEELGILYGQMYEYTSTYESKNLALNYFEKALFVYNKELHPNEYNRIILKIKQLKIES